VNLQPIPVSTVLNPILKRHGLGAARLGRCVNPKQVLNAPAGFRTMCAAEVWEGTGFADLDGAPFKAYYCASCANTLKGN